MPGLFISPERAQMPLTVIDYNSELHSCFRSETFSNLSFSFFFFFFYTFSFFHLIWHDEWLQVGLNLFQLPLVDFIKIIWNLRKLPSTFWWISIYISFGPEQRGNSCSSQDCDGCLDDSVIITYLLCACCLCICSVFQYVVLSGCQD